LSLDHSISLRIELKDVLSHFAHVRTFLLPAPSPSLVFEPTLNQSFDALTGVFSVRQKVCDSQILIEHIDV
jgi:hypothetical protein